MFCGIGYVNITNDEAQRSMFCGIGYVNIRMTKQNDACFVELDM